MRVAAMAAAVATLASLLVGIPTAAVAEPDGTTTWSGDGDGTSWSDDENWVSGVPGPGDIAVIASAATITYNADPSATVGVEIQIAASGVVIEGGTLSPAVVRVGAGVAATITAELISTMAMYLGDNATLVLSGRLGRDDADANIQFTGADGMDVDGAVVALRGPDANRAWIKVDGGLTLDLGKDPHAGAGQDITMGVGPLNSPAYLLWSADYQFYGTPLDVPMFALENGSVANLAGHADQVDFQNMGPGTVIDLGGGTLGIQRDLYTRGTTQITNGTLHITDGGTISVASAGGLEDPLLTIGATLTGSEDLDVTLAGPDANTLTLRLMSACSYTGAMAVSGTGRVQLDAGYGGNITLDDASHQQVHNLNENCNPGVGALPTQPRSVGAVLQDDGTVHVSWLPPVSAGTAPLSGYIVQRRRGVLGGWDEVARLDDAEAVSFIDATLVADGNDYQYQVAAVSSLGVGNWSAPSPLVTAPQKPGVPRFVTAFGGDERIQVSWLEPKDSGHDAGGHAPLLGYRLYRSLVSSERGDEIAEIPYDYRTNMKYVDEGLENGTTYYYSVLAFTRVGDGDPADTVAAIPAVETGLSLSMIQLHEAYPGGTVPLVLTASNNADVTAQGPLTITLMLPAPLTVASAGSTDWQCSTDTLGKQTVLRCELPDVVNIPKMEAAPPLPVSLGVPEDAALGTLQLDYAITAFNVTSASITPFDLSIVTVKRAKPKLDLVSGDARISGDPANPSRLEFVLRNDGDGAAVTPPIMEIDVPAQVTIHDYSSGDWDCERDVNKFTCVLKAEGLFDGMLPAGAEASPLWMTVSAPMVTAAGRGPSSAFFMLAILEDAYDRSSTVRYHVMQHTRADWQVLVTATTSVPSALRATEPGTSVYRLEVTNEGGFTINDDLVIAQTLPAGVLVKRIGPDDGWICNQVDTSVTCRRSGVEFAAGDSILGPILQATLPPGLRSATTWGLSAYAIHGGFYPGPTAALNIDIAEQPTDPVLSTAVQLAQAPLYASIESSATVTLRGDPQTLKADAAPATFALIAPEGINLEQAKVSVARHGYPGGTDLPVCTVHAGPLPGGSSALICATDEPIPSGSEVAATVTFTAAANIAGELIFRAGTLAAVGATPSARREAAWSILATSGHTAFAASSAYTTNGVVFAADAGAPQRVDAATPDDTGALQPTRVVLDASGTPQIGKPIAYVWVQTAGPAVQWESATGTVGVPGKGSAPTLPAGFDLAAVSGSALGVVKATGRSVSFLAPAVQERTELAFRLLVTDGSTVATAVTTISVDPVADNPPVVDSVVVRNSDDGSLIDLTKPVAPGTPLTVTYTASDPDGDPVTITPAVVRPAEVAVSFTPDTADPHTTFSFVWPQAVSQLVIHATATDGRVDAHGQTVRSTHSFTIGPDPRPLGLTVAAPPTGAVPGESVTLVAALENADADTTVTWTKADDSTAVLTPGAGQVVVDVPSDAQPGDVITIHAAAASGTGSSATVAEATTVIVVVEAPELTLADAPAGAVALGDALALSASVSGGTAPYEYAWSIVHGAGTITHNDSTVVDATYTPPAQRGLVTLSLRVEDAAGVVVEQRRTVTVGDVPAATGAAEVCEPTGILGSIYAAAQGLAGDERVAVTYGSLAVDLGPAEELLAGVAGSCTSGTTFALNGASATFQGIGFTNLTGTLSAQKLTIASAEVHTPSSWKLTGLVASGVSFRFDTFAFEGTLTTHAALPVIATPSSVTGVTTQLSFQSAVLSMSAVAQFVGGGALALTGAYCLGAGDDRTSDCTDTPIGVTSPLGAKTFAVSATVADVSLLGGTFAGEGSFTNASGHVAGALALEWKPGATSDANFQITSASLNWTPEELAIGGTALVARNVVVDLHGSFVDSDNWSVTVEGGLDKEWSIAEGLTLAKYDKGTGTGTRASGTIAKQSGKFVFAVELGVSGGWTTGPLTLSDLWVRVASGTDAPAACELTPDQQGSTYVAFGGLATVTVSEEASLDIAAEACAVPGVGWTVLSSANASGIQLASGLDLSGVFLRAASRGGSTNVAIAGTGTALGVSASATVALYQPTSSTRGFVARLSVDLDKLGLPVKANGELIYSSTAVGDLGAVPGLDLALPAAGTTGDPSQCTGSGDDNPLTGLSIPRGFTALANFSLPGSLCGFLNENLGIPAAASVPVQISLSGIPVITAKIRAGSAGYTIMRKDDGTAVALKELSLTISPGGSFGIAGEGTLTLPKPDATTAADVSHLDISAGITIALGSVPAITIVMSKSGDVWEDAFGTTGLDLGDLAIQGGIVFTAPLPTPSIGFAAQIDNLPESWKEKLGVVSDASGKMEPMQFALNISVTHPILEITIGEANDLPALAPLAPYDSSLADAFTIDYAQLVIAPFGGNIGPFVYTPGFHLAFDAEIVNVDLSVRASVDMTTGAMAASADVGRFSVGGVDFTDTHLAFAIEPTKPRAQFEFSGAMSAGPIHASARVNVEAGREGSTAFVRAELDAAVGGIDLAGLASLDNGNLFARVDMRTNGMSASIDQFALGLSAQATVLDTRLVFYGGLKVSKASLESLDLVVGTSLIEIAGGITISGSGCDATKISFIPDGFSVPAFPAAGPCFQLSYASGPKSSFAVKVSGSLDVPDIGLAMVVDGTIDEKGIFVNEASVELANALTVKLTNSRVYYGTAAQLAGVEDVNAVGDSVQVNQGDFRISGLVNVKLLGFFGANLDVHIGKIGSSAWAKATADLSVMKESSVISASVRLAGSFQRVSGVSVWSLSGNGALSLGGYTIASASFLINNGGFAVAGAINLGPVAGQLSGAVSWDNGVKFTVTASGTLKILSVSVSAGITISNTTGAVVATATFDGRIGDKLRMSGSATFSTTGAFCAEGSANVYVAAVAASFCTPGTTRPGVFASVKIHENFAAMVSFASPSEFAGLAYVGFPSLSFGDIWCKFGCWGLQLSFSAYLIVGYSSQNNKWVCDSMACRTIEWAGPYLDGWASATGKGCIVKCLSGSLWVHIEVNPTRFCGSVGKIGVCYAPWWRIYRP